MASAAPPHRASDCATYGTSGISSGADGGSAAIARAATRNASAIRRERDQRRRERTPALATDGSIHEQDDDDNDQQQRDEAERDDRITTRQLRIDLRGLRGNGRELVPIQRSDGRFGAAEVEAVGR